ncbi:MAG: hypothetical protein PVG66_07045 [Chromatiales bacterium]|jgi:hypothetical protein
MNHMHHKEMKLSLQIEKAFREIALAHDIPDHEKTARLRNAYRQAWFEHDDKALQKWLERDAARQSAA